MISNGLRYGLGLCMSLLAAVGFGAMAMPEVVSNRGESLDRPENTIAAIQLANSDEEMVDPDFPEGTTLLDVGSYVQNGLVGHFDAIRNAGADLPHDNSATVWKNLAGGPDATFTHRSNSPSPGYWKAKSYFFNNGTMASTTDTMNLGVNFTVQIAVNAFPGGQTGTTASNNQSNTYNAWYTDNPKENRGFW
ncbi:MAG: hypothetical protein J6334_00520, partial [Kiritimatiellae bacterium]|nr:hypothetical protein [Kiritimatiellia bacterium]